MATLMFLTAAQSMVQLTTPDGLRGRVAGIYNLVFIGGGAIGGPTVGWIAQHWGARTALLLAGLIPAAATVAIGIKLARAGRFRVVVIRPVAAGCRAPVRLGLEQLPVRLSRPAAPRIDRPFPLVRHRGRNQTVRPRRTRRKPLHH